MDKESLRLTFASLSLLYPPVSRFTGTQLPELYAALCKRHQFETFDMASGSGATLSTEGIRELSLERGSLTIEEHIQGARGFDLVRRNYIDMVEIIKEQLNIEVFFAPRMVMRGSVTLPDQQDVSDIMREKAISIRDDQFALLEAEEVEQIGIRIYANISDSHHAHLGLTPSSTNPNVLYLSLGSYRRDQIETVTVLDTRLQESYDYFFGQILRFVGAVIG